MKNALKIAGAACLCLGVALGQPATYTYDRNADFSPYRTYRWIEIKDATHPDQLVDQQIREAADAVLGEKTLWLVNDDSADLCIGFQIAVGGERQIETYNAGGVWGYGPGWGAGASASTPSTIRAGQLVIDVYDTKTRQLVWRGIGLKEMDLTARPDKRQKDITKIVDRILKNYPPKGTVSESL